MFDSIGADSGRYLVQSKVQRLYSPCPSRHFNQTAFSLNLQCMVEPLDVTCLHSVTLYLTYSTDLPMYMYQALQAALLPPILVADGEYLVSLFVKYFSTTMQYVNLLIELPSIRRQQSQQIQTQYRRKYKACTSSYQKKMIATPLNSTSGILPQSVRDNFFHESHNKREDFTSICFANTLCSKSLPNV